MVTLVAVPVLSAAVAPFTYAGVVEGAEGPVGLLVWLLFVWLLPPPQEIKAMQKIKVTASRSFLK